MSQLTALDAQFLHFETATNVANIAGLAVLEGSLNRADLQDLLEARLPYVPALHRKLAPVPFGLDHPYWVREDDLDLDYTYVRSGCRRRGTTGNWPSRWPGCIRAAWTGASRCGRSISSTGCAAGVPGSM